MTCWGLWGKRARLGALAGPVVEACFLFFALSAMAASGRRRRRPPGPVLRMTTTTATATVSYYLLCAGTKVIRSGAVMAVSLSQ